MMFFVFPVDSDDNHSFILVFRIAGVSFTFWLLLLLSWTNFLSLVSLSVTAGCFS